MSNVDGSVFGAVCVLCVRRRGRLLIKKVKKKGLVNRTGFPSETASERRKEKGTPRARNLKINKLTITGKREVIKNS